MFNQGQRSGPGIDQTIQNHIGQQMRKCFGARRQSRPEPGDSILVKFQIHLDQRPHQIFRSNQLSDRDVPTPE